MFSVLRGLVTHGEARTYTQHWGLQRNIFSIPAEMVSQPPPDIRVHLIQNTQGRPTLNNWFLSPLSLHRDKSSTPDDLIGSQQGSKILSRDVSLGINWSLLDFCSGKTWGCSDQKEICVWFTKWLGCYGLKESLEDRRNALLNLCCCLDPGSGEQPKVIIQL